MTDNPAKSFKPSSKAKAAIEVLRGHLKATAPSGMKVTLTAVIEFALIEQAKMVAASMSKKEA